MAAEAPVTGAHADTPLFKLTDDALRLLIFTLNARDAISLSNTCRPLRAFMDADGFWKTYMEHRMYPSKSGQYADPTLFPYEVLPRKLDWSDRELALLQSGRVCSGKGNQYCGLDDQHPQTGHWMCKDGFRRALCGSCHSEEHGSITYLWQEEKVKQLVWQTERRRVLMKAVAQEGLKWPVQDETARWFLCNRDTTLFTTQALMGPVRAHILNEHTCISFMLSQMKRRDLSEDEERSLQVRAMEIYHFVRARHVGIAKRCDCGRLLLKRDCVKICQQEFPNVSVISGEAMPGPGMTPHY